MFYLTAFRAGFGLPLLIIVILSLASPARCHDYPNLSQAEYSLLVEEGFTPQQIGLIDKLVKAIREALSDVDFRWPKTEAEWDDLSRIMRDEFLNLRTASELFIPGYGDFKSALKKFSTGNYLSASFDLAMALLDLFPGKKLAGIVTDVAQVTRKSFKIFSRISKLRAIDARFIDKMPKHWKMELSDRGEGIIWRNPLNPKYDHIRVMPGNPSSLYPNSRKPYVRRAINGGYVDKYGVVGNPRAAATHIPWSEFSDFDFH